MYNRRWGGWGPDGSSQLSVLELVKNGTMDLRLAGLFWALMEGRPSVIAAAGPSGAGKSTTLNVLLDFLRPDVKQIEIQGDDDFRFLKTAEPAKSYLVAAEFSNYGWYVWGDVAIRAFELISEGYALGGTVHARTAREVIEILHRYLGLKVAAITSIDMIVTLNVSGGRRYDDEPVRRIDAVTLITPHEKGIALQQIVSLASDGNSFEIADGKDLQAAVASKPVFKKGSVVKQAKEREEVLGKLLEEGKTSRDEVRRAVVEFYKSHPA